MRKATPIRDFCNRIVCRFLGHKFMSKDANPRTDYCLACGQRGEQA
jgi:hypothetical protein